MSKNAFRATFAKKYSQNILQNANNCIYFHHTSNNASKSKNHPFFSFLKKVDYWRGLIVIDCAPDKAFTLLSITTTNKSQFYFNFKDIAINHGSIRNNKNEIFMYCFPAGDVIGIGGFAFPEHTFLLTETGFRKHSCEEMYGLKVEYIDELTNDEFVNLLYSFKSSPSTKNKLIPQIEKVLFEIHK